MSVPALFDGLFDDAALFPPGNAAMPAAISDHLAYRQADYAALVGRFVCPSGRLAEFDTELRRQSAAPQAVSLTVPGGPDELPDALRLADSLAGVRLQAVELPVTADRLADSVELLRRTAESGVTVFAEIAVPELSPALADALVEGGLGLKLRTGGSTAGAFPGVTELARAVAVAVSAGVRFKCTAGLHHAIAHTDPATGFVQHGFLNVLLAIHAARTGADPAAQLASRDSAMLARQAGALSGTEVAELRARFRSIGSCSITEPLTDLETLGVVAFP